MPAVKGTVIKERAWRLRQKGNRRLDEYLHAQSGKLVDVLVERDLIGRTPQFTEIRLDQPASTGELVRARVSGVSDDHMLLGTCEPGSMMQYTSGPEAGRQGEGVF